jgi:hypothetical protein
MDFFPEGKGTRSQVSFSKREWYSATTDLFPKCGVKYLCIGVGFLARGEKGFLCIMVCIFIIRIRSSGVGSLSLLR